MLHPAIPENCNRETYVGTTLKPDQIHFKIGQVKNGT